MYYLILCCSISRHLPICTFWAILVVLSLKIAILGPFQSKNGVVWPIKILDDDAY